MPELAGTVADAFEAQVREHEERSLSPLAVRSYETRGRLREEDDCRLRTPFQRDRDRILHSKPFRRLKGKTQVFIDPAGDHYRTRMTHTLETTGIARVVARALRLNEDLVEAISLAHDLGHTPFGHAGQDALNACMKNHGGFEHNLQSLLVVDELEERYGGFNGLNLTFETREGILKHCSRVNAAALGELGRRFLEGAQPSLEAQLANLADEIAYNNHDIDDGLRSGLLTLEQLDEVPMWGRHRAEVTAAFPGINGRRAINETVRRMINTLIVDLIETTSRNIAAANPRSIDAVRSAGPLIGFSAQIHEEAAALKRFLFRHLYRHYLVMRMSSKAQRIVSDLFGAFMSDSRLLPPQYQAPHGGDQSRLIANYIAGMTDRYAIREHRRIFAVSEGN